MGRWAQASRSQTIGRGASGRRSEATTAKTAPPRRAAARKRLRGRIEDLHDRGWPSRQEAGRRPVERDPALLQQHDVLDEVADLLQPVRAEDKRRRRRDPPVQGEEGGAAARVEAGRRLVEDVERRVDGEGEREQDLL